MAVSASRCVRRDEEGHGDGCSVDGLDGQANVAARDGLEGVSHTGFQTKALSASQVSRFAGSWDSESSDEGSPPFRAASQRNRSTSVRCAARRGCRDPYSVWKYTESTTESMARRTRSAPPLTPAKEATLDSAPARSSVRERASASLPPAEWTARRWRAPRW